MMKKKHEIGVLVLLAILLAFSNIFARETARDQLEGTYSVKGWNPGADTNSKPYNETVTIKKMDRYMNLTG